VRSTRLGGAVALALAAAALLAEGLWIPAKAVLAQALLERAYRSAAAGALPRPWPWADFVPLARLSVPRLGASAIVLSGATGGTLAFGPGHLDGSAAPGADGNVVVVGHRDTHFSFLRAVAAGDALLLEKPGGPARRYTVREARVVHERDVAVLAPTAEPTLTLVTCWPFDSPVVGGPLRFVVVARAPPPGDTLPP
jgi:sortase A